MNIFVDADACPVTAIVEKIAKEYQIPVVLLCDTNHMLSSEYCTVKVIDAGRDAVDIALINLVKRTILLSHRTTVSRQWRLGERQKRSIRAAGGIRTRISIVC